MYNVAFWGGGGGGIVVTVTFAFSLLGHLFLSVYIVVPIKLGQCPIKITFARTFAKFSRTLSDVRQ